MSAGVSMGPGRSTGILAQLGLSQLWSDLPLLRAEGVQHPGILLCQCVIEKRELPRFCLRFGGSTALLLALWRWLGGAEVHVCFGEGKALPGEPGWKRCIDLGRVRSLDCVHGCPGLVKDVEQQVQERGVMCYITGSEIRQGKDSSSQRTSRWTSLLAVGRPGLWVTFWLSAGPAGPR